MLVWLILENEIFEGCEEQLYLPCLGTLSVRSLP